MYKDYLCDKVILGYNSDDIDRVGYFVKIMKIVDNNFLLRKLIFFLLE